VKIWGRVAGGGQAKSHPTCNPRRPSNRPPFCPNHGESGIVRRVSLAASCGLLRLRTSSSSALIIRTRTLLAITPRPICYDGERRSSSFLWIARLFSSQCEFLLAFVAKCPDLDHRHLCSEPGSSCADCAKSLTMLFVHGDAPPDNHGRLFLMLNPLYSFP
jgi:hypothetical protein